MALTTAQLATLKTAIIADPTAGPMRTAGDSFSLGVWCNGPSATLAWQTAVAPQASDEAATYTLFDSIIAGKRDSWRIFLGFSRDYTKAKIRTWIVDVWGAAIAASVSEAILLAGTVFATNAQNVFGGLSRTTGTVTAINRVYDGTVTQAELNQLVS